MFHFPIQTNVQGKTQFTIRAPICVAANAEVDPEKVYAVNLSFFSSNGQQFGQIIPINVQCSGAVDPQTPNPDQHLQASNQVATDKKHANWRI